MKNEKKGYAVGEVFRHTDGKVYQCVEGGNCKRCAFEYNDSDCRSLYCSSFGREDGRPVKFILVAEPVEGMLYRAKNGRMYRLAEGSHWDHRCACDDDNSLSCGALDAAVFGGSGLRWYWAPVAEDAPAPVDPPKPPEPSKRHIELSVVTVEDDEVTFKIVDQTHRSSEFSQQVNSDEFKASNGITLKSSAFPYWYSSDSSLCCRGYRADMDDIALTHTVKEFAQICEAVAEYNATDGRGYEKPWPSVGDKYFCIAAEGKVDRLTFTMDGFDRKAQDFGNFFRTKEEAEAAIDRVKQALKK